MRIGQRRSNGSSRSAAGNFGQGWTPTLGRRFGSSHHPLCSGLLDRSRGAPKNSFLFLRVACDRPYPPGAALRKQRCGPWRATNAPLS